MSSAPSVVAGAVLAGNRRRELAKYRYTFLDHADEERAVAAFELFVSSEEDACKLANELLERADSRYVEVWRDGRLVLRLAKLPPDRR